MPMKHCGWHDINYSGRECPRCVADERHLDILDQAQERDEVTARAIEESDYRRANPGDYECPSCFYVTLKRSAPRCPICRSDVPGDHWAKVFAAEEAKAELKRAREAAEAAEWARNAPAREAAARAAAAAKEAKEKAARNAEIARWKAVRNAEIARGFLAFYFAYPFPALILGAGIIWRSLINGESVLLGFEMMTTLVPFLNWLALASILITSDARATYFILSVVFLALGAVIKTAIENGFINLRSIWP